MSHSVFFTKAFFLLCCSVYFSTVFAEQAEAQGSSGEILSRLTPEEKDEVLKIVGAAVGEVQRENNNDKLLEVIGITSGLLIVTLGTIFALLVYKTVSSLRPVRLERPAEEETRAEERHTELVADLAGVRVAQERLQTELVRLQTEQQVSFAALRARGVFPVE